MKIYYVLVHTDSCVTHGVSIEDVRITKHICKENDPSIISTHNAFCFEVNYRAPDDTIKAPGSNVDFKSVNIVNKKIDWGNTDISSYQSALN